MAIRVLIVDDAAFSRSLLTNILVPNGYEIAGAGTTGAQGVDLYEELRPHIVIMDIAMPIMDGVTATQKIMQMDPAAKIVMCTAIGQQTVVLEALKIGAKDFIIKPFQAERVLGALEKIVG